MKKDITNLLNFYIAAEKLKITMRHSYTSDNSRMESSAEHSWMLCLMAMTLFEYIEIEIDQLKVLKMLTIHDLAEAVTGDIPAFEISERQVNKYQSEFAAFKKLTTKLSPPMKKEILSLWKEFEEKKTNEAKIAQMIDKMEAPLQHAIAGAHTWDEGDFKHHGAHIKLDYSQTKYLALLRDAITKFSIERVVEAKQLERANNEIKQIYAQSTFKKKIPSQKITKLLTFYIEAEKLKATTRHSWTSDSTRAESTAEHSWLLSLIALTVFEKLTTKVDQLKTLKILILHDLAEAVTGDIPTFEISERKKNKKANELAAMKHLTRNLSARTRKEFLKLWNEYEERKTLEGQLAQAIDKFESVIQNNVSDFSTWDQNDFDVHPFYKYDYTKFDSFLHTLREQLEEMSRARFVQAGLLSRLKPDAQMRYKEMEKKIT